MLQRPLFAVILILLLVRRREHHVQQLDDLLEFFQKFCEKNRRIFFQKYVKNISDFSPFTNIGMVAVPQALHLAEHPQLRIQLTLQWYLLQGHNALALLLENLLSKKFSDGPELQAFQAIQTRISSFLSIFRQKSFLGQGSRGSTCPEKFQDFFEWSL